MKSFNKKEERQETFRRKLSNKGKINELTFHILELMRNTKDVFFKFSASYGMESV